MKRYIVAHSYGLVGFTRKLRPNIRFSLYTEQTQRLHLNFTYSSEAIDIQIDESVAVGASNDPTFVSLTEKKKLDLSRRSFAVCSEVFIDHLAPLYSGLVLGTQCATHLDIYKK